jgi:hypothetical protein
MQVKQSIFTAYDFSNEEMAAAVNFSPLQRAFFQTQLAEAAEEKLKLPYTDENKQREAELSGRILFLEWLLALTPDLYITDENFHEPI